jgi:peptide/nickel transport system permease protein
MTRLRFGLGARIGACVLLAIVLMVAAAPLYVPQNPFDPIAPKLLHPLAPPSLLHSWAKYPLGTDAQGRDILAAILYGARPGFVVGALATLAATLMGVALGLAAGLSGGIVDRVLTGLANAQRTVPSLLAALLVDGVLRALLPYSWLEAAAMPILVVSIALARWPHFACAVRDAAHALRNRDHMLAARLVGHTNFDAVLDHVLPGIVGPALATMSATLVLAVADEATLSFLGAGLPAARPSLGTLIRRGFDPLPAGPWWAVLFPALALAIVLLIAHILAAAVHARLAPDAEDRVPS